MIRHASLRLALLAALTTTASAVPAQTPIAGTYTGTTTYRGQQVPLRIEITGPAAHLHAALVNGPAAAHATGLDRSVASSVSLDGQHLIIAFNYFNASLDLLASPDGHLTGSFGPPPASTATRIPVQLERAKPVAPASGAPVVTGAWEVEVHSLKGETAWQLLISPTGRPGEIRAVFQRIDGDSGSLFGRWNGSSFLVSHFNPDGPTYWSITPHGSELRLTNLLASDANKPWQTDITARHPADARKLNLPAPTKPTDQTSLKNPASPLRFAGKTLEGRTFTQSDPSLRGKVVLVAIGGSWCPNCHDEAPFLESLYKQFHPQGLEIVSLNFEDGDQLTNPTRLHAFVARYGLTYNILLAGHKDDLNQVIPGVTNLNSWPTSFFIGRDGRVKEIHAGFAGPANPAGNVELRQNITALVQRLLYQTQLN